MWLNRSNQVRIYPVEHKKVGFGLDQGPDLVEYHALKKIRDYTLTGKLSFL